MGQKINPISIRVGVIRNWESCWYSEKEFGDFLYEDYLIRKLILSFLKKAYISSIEIERLKNRAIISIKSSRPGVVIGVKGKNIENLKKKIKKISTKAAIIEIKVLEIKNPDLNAYLVARNIGEQIERRISYKMAQKRAIQKTMRAGAKGIKTLVSGRLGGVDIARSEWYSEGIIPLHTLYFDIDYALYAAKTTYGVIGVKVWICKGRVLPGQKIESKENLNKFNIYDKKKHQTKQEKLSLLVDQNEGNKIKKK